MFIIASMSQLSTPRAKPQTESASVAARAISGETRGELWIALLVFATAILYLWPLRDYLSFNADEGVTLTMAERILHGQIPYRDFFTFVTPGSPYLMALWFKLFGPSYLVARNVLLTYAGIFGALTYLLARRLGGRSAALWAAALLILGCMPSRFLVLHNWDSTLFALLAIYCAQSWLGSAGWPLPFLLGITTSATVLTEQSKGAGLVLGLVIAALALNVPLRSRYRPRARELSAVVVGFAIPWAIVFAYFASQHAIPGMLADWLWPLHHFNSAVNREPYGAPPITVEALQDLFSSASWLVRIVLAAIGAPLLLISLLLLLTVAATVHAVILRRSTAPSRALDRRVLGGCMFLGVFLSVLSTGRADLNHLIYLTPLFIYLVPGIFDLSYGDIRHRGVRLFGTVGPLVAGLVLISFIGFGLITLLPAIKATTRVETPRGKVRMAYRDEVLPYVEKNVPPGAPLYVHPYQALYSFMTRTQNPARTAFLLPGMNTREQYHEVIGELEATKTPYVLLNPDFSDLMRITWPSAPAEIMATDPVESYILAHYRSCRVLNTSPQQTWRFYFMVRTNLPCPSNPR